MAEKLQYSVPLIQRALKYGHVKQPELPALITQYFSARLTDEANAANDLIQQTTTKEQ